MSQAIGRKWKTQRRGDSEKKSLLGGSFCHGALLPSEYIWSEATFARTMLPFHSNIRVGYNGTEVDGKSVMELMTLTPPEGTKVRVCIEGPDAADAMHAVDQFVQSRSDED